MIVPALVVLIGFALRLGMATLEIRFHPDEALFAAQARLINTEGDLLLRTTDLDKPPLTFYVTALSFSVLGPGEFPARLPNVLFSTLNIAAVYGLTLRLYGKPRTATWAALLVAFSPFDLAFAGTAFTDVQATFWVVTAALLATHDRWTYAGGACALVIASKPTAALFVPLILALGLARNARTTWGVGHVGQRLAAFGLPLAIGIGSLAVWDASRAPRSFFSLGYARNNPGRLIRSDELWPHLKQWGHWLSYFSGSLVLDVAFIGGAAVRLAGDWRQWRLRSAAADWLIAGFGVAFIGWHWLIAFNTYDRYMHTLIPFAAILAARGLTQIETLRFASPSSPRGEGLRERLNQSLKWLLTAAVCALMLLGAGRALSGSLPLGGDQGQHTGIDTVAEYLNTSLNGEIVYNHWLGWELAYYLGPHPQVTLQYSPQPEALADDFTTQHEARYLVAPSLWDAAPWLDVLRQAQVRVDVVFHDSHGFRVFRLTPADNGQQTGGAVYYE